MKTKECFHCKETKLLTEFYKQGKSKDGYQPRCKVCHGIHNKSHYQRNKKAYIKRATVGRIKLKEWFIEMKSQLHCEKCSEDKYWRLDFHHSDPDTKDGTISDFVSNNRPKEVILKEIKKCQVLCRNCHADVHHYEHNE